MKVLAVIITDDRVEPRCREAAFSQTYKNYQVMIHQKDAEVLHPDPVHNLYLNCSRTREEARRRALQYDHTHFLFLDSDIVVPPTAVEEFVIQSQPAKIPTPHPQIPGRLILVDRKDRVLGGWYEMRNDPIGRWIAGKWLDNDLFINYRSPERSLVATDMVGLGCAFIPRSILEKVSFRDGTELRCTCAWTEQSVLVGECGAFGNDVAAEGYEMLMDGDVICEHLQRGKAK